MLLIAVYIVKILIYRQMNQSAEQEIYLIQDKLEIRGKNVGDPLMSYICVIWFVCFFKWEEK